MASIFEFAAKSTPLSARDPEDGTSKTTSLEELVNQACPSLWRPFNPAWFLFNGHLQTIYNVIGNFTHVDRVWYRRTFLRLKDGSTIGLDFFNGPTKDSIQEEDDDSDVPIIVAMPGLTGGSYEPYIRTVLAQACAPLKQDGLGYRAVVVHHRGFGGAPLTTPSMHCAPETNGLRHAMIYLTHKYPNAPLLGIGFSAGANLGVRYLSEDGPYARLDALCGLACPWNLKDNSYWLHKDFLHRKLYGRALGNNFQKMFRKHSSVLLQDSARPLVKASMGEAISLKKPTLRDVDDTVWKKLGRETDPFPFADVDEYYLWGSSHQHLENVKVPCLMINSLDDPIVRALPHHPEPNPWVVKVLTPHGGHLGWFQKTAGTYFGVERWTTKPVMEWFKLVGERVQHGQRRWLEVYEDEDGFLVERNGLDPNLGCKLVEGSERIVDGCLENEKDDLIQGL